MSNEQQKIWNHSKWSNKRTNSVLDSNCGLPRPGHRLGILCAYFTLKFLMWFVEPCSTSLVRPGSTLFIFLVASSSRKSVIQVCSTESKWSEESTAYCMTSIPWLCRRLVITLAAWGLALYCWKRVTLGCASLDHSTLLIYRFFDDDVLLWQLQYVLQMLQHNGTG